MSLKLSAGCNSFHWHSLQLFAGSLRFAGPRHMVSGAAESWEHESAACLPRVAKRHRMHADDIDGTGWKKGPGVLRVGPFFRMGVISRSGVRNESDWAKFDYARKATCGANPFQHDVVLEEGLKEVRALLCGYLCVACASQLTVWQAIDWQVGLPPEHVMAQRQEMITQLMVMTAVRVVVTLVVFRCCGRLQMRPCGPLAYRGNGSQVVAGILSAMRWPGM